MEDKTKKDNEDNKFKISPKGEDWDYEMWWDAVNGMPDEEDI